MPRNGFPMLLLRLPALLDAEAMYLLKSSSIICTCSPSMYERRGAGRREDTLLIELNVFPKMFLKTEIHFLYSVRFIHIRVVHCRRDFLGAHLNVKGV